MPNIDELRAQLKKIGSSYARHRDAMQADREAMEPVIVEALRAGMSPSEVQELSHLSPATIRTARVAAGLPPRGVARDKRKATEMREPEVKILNIDPDEMQQRILDKGGVKIAERRMRRRVYDIVPGDLSRWIRVRDTGTKVTVATKHVIHDGIDGVDEEELTVDSFDGADRLLNMLGFSAKSYQENNRISFTLDGARLEIDSWPLIPPYLEIEADSPAEVLRVAALLGIPESDLTTDGSYAVYARYDIDLAAIADLRF